MKKTQIHSSQLKAWKVPNEGSSILSIWWRPKPVSSWHPLTVSSADRTGRAALPVSLTKALILFTRAETPWCNHSLRPLPANSSITLVSNVLPHEFWGNTNIQTTAATDIIRKAIVTDCLPFFFGVLKIWLTCNSATFLWSAMQHFNTHTRYKLNDSGDQNVCFTLCLEHFSSPLQFLTQYTIHYCELQSPPGAVEHWNLLLLSNYILVPIFSIPFSQVFRFSNNHYFKFQPTVEFFFFNSHV